MHAVHSLDFYVNLKHTKFWSNK